MGQELTVVDADVSHHFVVVRDWLSQHQRSIEHTLFCINIDHFLCETSVFTFLTGALKSTSIELFYKAGDFGCFSVPGILLLFEFWLIMVFGVEADFWISIEAG